MGQASSLSDKWHVHSIGGVTHVDFGPRDTLPKEDVFDELRGCACGFFGIWHSDPSLGDLGDAMRQVGAVDGHLAGWLRFCLGPRSQLLMRTHAHLAGGR